MNQEPVKFLPLSTGKGPFPVIKGVHPEAAIDHINQIYQHNWDLKVALDRSRDLSKTMMWIAIGGWATALVLVIASQI